MKRTQRFQAVLGFMIALVLFSATGSIANANDTAVLNGQTVILVSQSTVDAISAELAKKIIVEEKEKTIAVLLMYEADVKGGFCDTVVSVYSVEFNKKPEKVRKTCDYVMSDSDTINSIASGDVSNLNDPKNPNRTFQEKLSLVISGTIALYLTM